MSPKRDIVWDELERLFGPVTNAQTRGRRNKVTRMVKDSIMALAEIDPKRFPRDDDQVRDLIRGRYSRYTQLWPGIKPTDSGLMNRWDDCDPHLAGMTVNGPTLPRRIDEPVAPPEVARSYIDQMRERGWISGEAGEGSSAQPSA